jgi:hypothetical protein
VKALALINGELYVGGRFSAAGGVAASSIAKWDGSTWSALGSGLGPSTHSIVYALAVNNGELYAGGYFSPFNHIAKWNGSTWSGLGSGIADPNGYVCALAVSNGDLYMGGFFTRVGGTAANNIAKWNGTSWNALSTGTSGNSSNTVLALAVNGPDLYVGGLFTLAGGTTASRIAKWNGSAWSSLGSGLNHAVTALAVSAGNKLNVGGGFLALGDGSKVTAYFGIFDDAPAGPLAIATAHPSQASALAPNPANATATLTLPAVPHARPVLVLDALGRTVRRLTLPARTSHATIDLLGLPAGVYSVRCGAATARLVIE